MSHGIRAFVGPKAALRPFAGVVPRATAYALVPAAPYFVLPVTEAVLDALHAAYGTGEWLEGAAPHGAPMLTSTDLAFAAKASLGSALAYVETDYFGGEGAQRAVAWIDGEIAVKPAAFATASQRSHTLWPVNTALRAIGVKAAGPAATGDEFTVMGLGHFRSNEEIISRATLVGL